MCRNLVDVNLLLLCRKPSPICRVHRWSFACQFAVRCLPRTNLPMKASNDWLLCGLSSKSNVTSSLCSWERRSDRRGQFRQRKRPSCVTSNNEVAQEHAVLRNGRRRTGVQTVSLTIRANLTVRQDALCTCTRVVEEVDLS